MMNIEDEGLFEIFPMIETISNSFEYQNATLNKIVLTGKINALEIAENLFNFTEQTAQTFSELQAKLIKHLLEENKKELLLKAKLKTKVVLEILKMSFDNRKKEIELLSKDKTIIDFLTFKIEKEVLQEKLDKYAKYHTIYSEILILDPKGKHLIHTNSSNNLRYSKDEIVRKVQKTSETLMQFRQTDMFVKQRESLFFVKRIEKDGEVLGVLVMFYNLQEEGKFIFDNLITEKEEIIVVDKYNNILFSSEKGIEKNFVRKINVVDNFMIINHKFYYRTKLEKLEDIFVIISYPRSDDINVISEFDSKNINNRELIDIGVNNDDIKKLADDGYEILEDLSDVIINGELIAAKSKQYILIPILDNLREVSFKVVKLIELSISNLQKIINYSMKNYTKFLSKAIAELIGRYMYERCLNIQAFGLNSEIFENRTLEYLNNLYPMYSDIFVYDENSKILAVSNSKHFKGEILEHHHTNHDPEKCFSTTFLPSKFYNDKPTYTCFVSILKENKMIGGVGEVLDINKEFFLLLDDFCDENRIAIIVNSRKKIVYSTHLDFVQSEDFSLIEELKDDYDTDIVFNDAHYKLAISKVKDYRNQKTELYSIVMVLK